MNSPQFKPFFERLYKNAILPRQQADPGRQGPQKKEVLAAIARADKFGDERYTSEFIDTSGFEQEDHYAYCLVKLVQCNTENCNGVFYKQQINQADKEARIWMAMIRATQDKGATRRKNQNVEELQSKIKRDIFSDSPNELMPNQEKSADRDNGTYEKQPLSKPSQSKPSLSTTNPSPSNPSLSTTKPSPTNLMQGLTPKKLKLEHPNKDYNTPPSVDRSELGRAFPELANNIIGASSQLHWGLGGGDDEGDDEGDDSTIQGDNDNIKENASGGDNPNVNDESNSENDVNHMARLLARSNPENPLDLTTEYGKYSMIHAVLRHFADKAQLQRLVTGPSKDDYNDDAGFVQLSEQWYRETRALMKAKESIAFEPTTAEQKVAEELVEKMLDNSAYQPTDYTGACNSLGLDPDRPRFSSMNIVNHFHSWQVTGINRLVEIHDNPDTRAAILADATGLGKTIELLGFIIHVSALDSPAQTVHAMLTLI